MSRHNCPSCRCKPANDTIKCPVCPRHLLKVGMKNHIRGKATQEMFHKDKKQPHVDYYFRKLSKYVPDRL